MHAPLFSDDSSANAAQLLSYGWSIIPVAPGSKKAAVKWLEFQRRKPTPEEVHAWAMRYGSWAVVTGAISGIVVVDCDSPEALEWAREHLPFTPCEVLTSEKAPGFRGRHLYYRHPGGHVGNRARIRCDSETLALDVRGDGGYVLAPGSLHPSGVRYEPVGVFDWSHIPTLPASALDTPEPAPPPPRLRIVPDDDRYRRATAWIARRDPAVEGHGGNDHTFRTACSLVRGFELDDEDALALLLDWNLSCCPPWTEDELRQFIDNARAYGKEPFGSLLQVPLERQASAPAEPADWQPPEPLAYFRPPTFPLHCLGDLMAEYVDALATATQTPVDLAGMLVLAAVGACIQGRVEVEARAGWREGTNIYTVTSLPPGNRKSAVMSAIMRPMIEWERVRGENLKPARLDAEERRLSLERQVEAARKRNAPTCEIAALRLELEDLAVPPLPRVVADDITPERAASLMAENGERLAIFSAEGGIFDIIAGRYSSNGGANLDVFLKAHSGEVLKVDRQRKEHQPIFMLSPRLTLGLAVQPEVLDGLFAQPGFRGRGLLARFVFTTPASLVGSRDVRPPSVPHHVEHRYRDGIRRLLDWSASLSETAVLSLDTEADLLLEDYERRLEPRLREVFGDLSDIADWASKSAGLAVRLGGVLGILGILACTRDSLSSSFFMSLRRDHMERAVRIVEDYLIPHALHAFGRMGADPVMVCARHILRWVEGRSRFTHRELQQATKHNSLFPSADSLDAPLRVLEEHGYIRQDSTPRARSGRPPKPTYLVNPIQPS